MNDSVLDNYKNLAIDELLDLFIEANKEKEAYMYRDDSINWSQEKEDAAFEKYHFIRCEIKRRCGERDI